MGGNSSGLRFKSRSTTDVDRIRPTAEQRNPKKRNRLSAFALSSSKHFGKISFKRKGGSREKVRTFRDLITSWPIEDVESLYREMDALRVLSLLSDSADAARVPVPSIGVQMMQSTTQNVTLVFKGSSYPIHSRWFRTRSDQISRLLSNSNVSVLELTSPLGWVEEEHFKEFLSYVYTDDCQLDDGILHSLKDWFEIKRPLSEDLLLMEQTSEEEGDLTIVLTTQSVIDKEKSSPCDFSIRVDSELIGARSPLFASLVKRKQEDRVVLDESLLPRSLMPLVVHYLYTDQLDLSKVSSTAVSLSSLSEARAIVNGHSPHSPLHRASQIVHIAKFFGFNKLVQLCEDVIVSSLCADSAISVLTWAEDGGSSFVANMTRAFLVREFSRVAASHYLFDISLAQLQHCLSSHFLQATEVEVLEAVVKWGEHELLKRMENREPNVVADTSHSISRRGIRRTELSDAELKEILYPVSCLVRTDFILPPFHQSLNSAYRRGIIERSPLKDLVVCSSTAEINPDVHWFCPDPEAAGPRFYLPYYQATKAHLSHLYSEESGPSCSSRSDATMGRGSATPLRIHVSQTDPSLLEDEAFSTLRSDLLSQIEKADAVYGIRFMPRPFHRRTAVELLASRILREKEVDPSSVIVRISDWAESQESSSTTSSSRLHSSQPALNWPDIMTLERKKKGAKAATETFVSDV